MAEQAEGISPDEGMTLKVLGHMYWRLGYLGKAERLFRSLRVEQPEDSQAAGLLAAVLLDLDKAEEALELIESLVKGPLASSESYLWLIRARALGRLDRLAEAQASLDEFTMAGVGI